jgi:hypothetical protein
MSEEQAAFAAGALPQAASATSDRTGGNSVPGGRAVAYDTSTQQPDYNATVTVPNADALRPFRMDANSNEGARGFKYSVKTRTYPAAVSGDKDLQHYMCFFINIRGKSKYRDRFKSTPISTGGQNRLQSEGLVDAGAFAAAAGATTLAAGAIGSVLGNSVNNLIGANLKGVGNGAKTVTPLQQFATSGFGKGVIGGGLAIGGGILGMAGNRATGFFEPDQSARIDQAIMLAINKAPEVKYGVEYDAKDLGTMVGLISGGSSAVDAMDNERNSEYAKSVAMNVANIPKGIADVFGGDLDFGSALKQGMGVAPNPFREQVFRNVQTREFTFEYKFLPRNKTEVDNVQNIIYQFKFHMHPEVSTGGLFYIYPSTFDIAYYYKGKENTNFNRISTCVLEDLAVDYGGQGFNTFASGSPTEINIKLRFRELEVLTKERIFQGY